MVKEALKRIFEFLEDNEGHNAPFKWKLVNNEPIAKEDLNIKGGLFLEHSNIASLPEGLKIGGNLNLSYTFKLKSLPSDLDVKGDIYLEGSKIESLPEGLKVGGDLDLTYTDIKSLPKGLEVGGDLHLELTTMMKYERYELLEMIKPGFVKGKIHK
jgi:hypothetical protein